MVQATALQLVADWLWKRSDGILEVTSQLRAERDVEFGAGALESLITQHSSLPLPEIAATIVRAVRGYG